MTDDVFEDLVNLYLDKEITSAQLDILRQELERNPHRQRVFQSYCRMHQATHFAALSQCPVIPTLGKSMAPGPHLLSHFIAKPAWMGAFLILVVAATSVTLYLNSPIAAPVEEEPIIGSVGQIDWFNAEVATPPRSANLEVFRTLQVQGQSLQNWDFTQELPPLHAAPEDLPSFRPEDFPFSSGYSGFLAEQEPASGFDVEHSIYEFKR